MTKREVIEMLTAKAECIRREASGTDIDCNLRNCDECDLCYKQGTTGDQMEALRVAISALQAQDLQPICNELAKDTISRQAAIDALKGHRALFCDNTPDTFSKLSYGEKCRVDELDTAISTLVDLPPAQPTQTDTSNTLKALDCIERQAAIDALIEEFKRTPTVAIRAKHVIEQLSSAQPERPKGKWINRSLSIMYPDWERYTCSACGKHAYNYDFCPNCGADMRGEQDERTN